MQHKLLLINYLILHVALASNDTPKVRVSIETNFGDAFKSFDDNILRDCGDVLDDSLPIGKFPWFVGIYYSKFSGMSYKCAGTLISTDLVLTSAACLQLRAEMNDPESLVIFFGKSNFLNLKGPVQLRTVRRVIIHPKFNLENHFADLALLRLSEPIERNKYINTVCISNVVKKLQGIVPGFEFKDSTKYIGKQLSSISMNIVDSKNCTLKYKKVTSIDPQRSSLFCASYESKQTCKGDEGAGYFFKTGNKWHIGGINSIGIGYQEKAVCDENHYSGFTNISPFLDWILGYI